LLKHIKWIGCIVANQLTLLNIAWRQFNEQFIPKTS
jgi:hypothetical protein